MDTALNFPSVSPPPISPHLPHLGNDNIIPSVALDEASTIFLKNTRSPSTNIFNIHPEFNHLRSHFSLGSICRHLLPGGSSLLICFSASYLCASCSLSSTYQPTKHLLVGPEPSNHLPSSVHGKPKPATPFTTSCTSVASCCCCASSGHICPTSF